MVFDGPTHFKYSISTENDEYLPYWHWGPLKSLGHWQTLNDKQLPPLMQGGSQVAEKYFKIIGG